MSHSVSEDAQGAPPASSKGGSGPVMPRRSRLYPWLALAPALAAVFSLAGDDRGHCPAHDPARMIWSAALSHPDLGPVGITIDSRYATAIASLRVRGREIVDTADHGRQIQSALALHQGPLATLVSERRNPTEAGSKRDRSRCRSSSEVISRTTSATTFEACTRMAYWLAPGQFSMGNPTHTALNSTALSRDVLCKRVEPGTPDADTIRLQLAFEVADPASATLAQFEVLTAYLADEFRRYHQLRNGRLVPLNHAHGEVPGPVVLESDRDGLALALLCRRIDGTTSGRITYGRFRFDRERVNKVNCVSRVEASGGLPRTRYTFEALIVLATRETIASRLTELSAWLD